MAKDQLTFNDLPTVVGELCDRIASMENLLSENISRQSAPQENTHVHKFSIIASNLLCIEFITVTILTCSS